MSERYVPKGAFMVTGAGGFLGGSMVEKLQSMGESVVATSRTTESELAERLGLQMLDVTDSEATRRFVADHLPQNIFHLAGIAMPSEVADHPERGRAVNVDSVFNLLDAINHAKKRYNLYDPTIIVAGSVEQFGDPVYEGQVFDEKSARNPINEYGRQKQEMATKFLKRCKKDGLRGYVVIQGQATGVSESGLISQDKGYFIPDIASQVAKIEASGDKRGYLVTGVVSQQRNIVDVKDAVRGYIALAEKTPQFGEYLVCASASQPLEDVLRILINYSPVEIIHNIEIAKGSGGRNRLYSNKNLRESTGWNTEIGLDKTIKNVLDYQRNKVR